MKSMEAVWNILATIREEERRKWRQRNHTRGDVWATRLLWAMIVCVIAILFLYGLTLLGWMTRENAYVYALIVLLLLYVFAFISQLAMIIPVLMHSRKRSMLLDNAKIYASVDFAEMPALVEQGEMVLRQAKHALDAETNRLRGSIELLVGKVGSIGLLPGLIAAVFLITKIMPVEQAVQAHFGIAGAFLMAIACANPILFAMAIFMQPSLWQLERLEKVLELAIHLSGERQGS